ncbi:MAG: CocE/NonD family hydrolase [Tenacibaculum sp.]|nr:CocE/NonD family hydrolase [Tenacibaculum sp.]
MKRSFLAVLFVISIQNIFAKSTLDTLNVSIKFYQKIELSDGIKLSSNIYFPENYDKRKKYPTVLVITPYVSDENHERGLFFSRNDYVFITVDCRGRGNSEGEFIPFESDGKDGAEVINWIGKQSWSNGKVGMFGGSYRGMNQWLILKEFPKNLKTIIPIASVGPGLDFPKYNNIFYPYVMRWLMLTSGKTINQKLFGEDFWKQKREQLYLEGKPFNSYDEIVGFPKKVFQKWISHPSHDEFWQQFYFTKEQSKKVNIPILSITGHFDSDQPGAMKYYSDHMNNGNEEAKSNHYLIVGPWSHGGTRRPKKEFWGLKFGENAVIDMNDLYLKWFNWTLKEGKKPTILKDKIMLYTMGENTWNYTTKLDELSNGEKELFLSSFNSEANDVFSSGDLLDAPLSNDLNPDIIVYDPSKKKGINSASYNSKISEVFTDQSYVNDEDILIYHSKPLEEDMEVNGKIRFEAYISMDVEDTDLEVTMYEISKDNSSKFLQKDQIRARYRKGLEKPVLVRKNVIEKYVFEGENLFSRVIKKGSRIRLVFSSIDKPNVQRNFNSKEDPSIQKMENAKIATIKLFHNKKYPSRIVLPIKR